MDSLLSIFFKYLVFLEHSSLYIYSFVKIQSDNNGYFVPGDSDAPIGPINRIHAGAFEECEKIYSYINNVLFIQFGELYVVFFILNVATVSFSHYNGT
jgi:hypothetical protein